MARRRFWIVTAVVVLALIGLALAAKPAWRAVKVMRAERFAREAEALIGEEKWVDAFQRTQSALQLAPKEPKILRLAARLYTRLGLDLALPYYESLFATSDITTEDRQECALLALRLGHRELAAAQVEALLEAPRRSPRSLLIASQHYALQKELDTAVGFAREALQIEAGNPTNTLALAQLLFATGRPEDQAEAAQLLWPLASSPGPAQLQSLSSLLQAPGSTRADRERILALLAAKPDRSLEEELVWLDAQVLLDPSRQGQVADELIERRGRGSLEETAAVAFWLNRQGLYSRTLGLLLPDIASRNLVLLDLRYQALVGSGDHRAAYDYVSREIRGADPIQIEKMRCLAALGMGDRATADSHMQSMLREAGSQPQALRVVADFALRNRNREVASEAARRLSRSPRDATAAYNALVQIADEQGETWVAREYVRKLAALRPEDPKPKLQLAYYDLLLNENVEQALATARSLYEADHTDFNRRALLAFALLRTNEPRQAADLIEAQTVNWIKVPAGIRATIIAIFGANGREDSARNLLAAVPIARLKPEERELVRPYVGIDVRPELPLLPPPPPVLSPLPKDL